LTHPDLCLIADRAVFSCGFSSPRLYSGLPGCTHSLFALCDKILAVIDKRAITHTTASFDETFIAQLNHTLPKLATIFRTRPWTSQRSSLCSVLWGRVPSPDLSNTGRDRRRHPTEGNGKDMLLAVRHKGKIFKLIDPAVAPADWQETTPNAHRVTQLSWAHGLEVEGFSEFELWRGRLQIEPAEEGDSYSPMRRLVISPKKA
jgi:hypothetical protein